MKIALVIDSLGAGGAEKVLSLLATYWHSKGHKVCLFTFDDGSSPPFHPLPTNLSRVPLNISTRQLSLSMKILSVPRVIKKLKEEISKFEPSIIVSFMDQANLLTLQALKEESVPIVVSERIYPAFSSLIEITPTSIGKYLAEQFRNVQYQSAARIVVQTEISKQYFPSTLQEKIDVIPNPCPPLQRLKHGESPSRRVLALGRLVKQKRFDLLIRAFAMLPKSCGTWSLSIGGDGPEKESLQSLINQLKLSSRVSLVGRIENANEFFSTGDLFVLSSDVEGFPNVLLEAMSLGLPCVSTDCKSGPSELIQHGINGLLVKPGNHEELARGIEMLIMDGHLRARLGHAATNVTERFASTKILEMWDRVITSLVGSQAFTRTDAYV